MSDDITWLVHIIKSDIDAAIRNVYADARWRFDNPEAHYHETVASAATCYIAGCAGVEPRVYLLEELENIIEDTKKKLNPADVLVYGLKNSQYVEKNGLEIFPR